MILIIMKIIFLYLAIAYGCSNMIKAFRKLGIGEAQMILMSIGIVGFVVIQFKLYLL